MSDSNDDKIFIARLEEVCRQYDRENGSYPESQYEGYEVFCEFIGRRPVVGEYSKDWLGEGPIEEKLEEES